jgi:hypothetical protein
MLVIVPGECPPEKRFNFCLNPQIEILLDRGSERQPIGALDVLLKSMLGQSLFLRLGELRVMGELRVKLTSISSS